MQYIEKCNPDVVQPYRNVMDDGFVKSGLCSFVNKNNLGVCFFSPIKHGLLTGKYQNKTVPKGSRLDITSTITPGLSGRIGPNTFKAVDEYLSIATNFGGLGGAKCL